MSARRGRDRPHAVAQHRPPRADTPLRYDPTTPYELARRVHEVLTGFLAVSTFVRAAFVQERLDCVGALFAGKLDRYVVPALVELRRLGLCRLLPTSHRGCSTPAGC